MTDAWRQKYDLQDKYTRSEDVRGDLRVTAQACDRAVSFGMKWPREWDEPPNRPPRWHTTTRNVGTMRELAYALLAACDFVEGSNPEWARNLQ